MVAVTSRKHATHLPSVMDSFLLALRLGLVSGLVDSSGVGAFFGDNCVGLGQYVSSPSVSDGGKNKGDSGEELMMMREKQQRMQIKNAKYSNKCKQ